MLPTLTCHDIAGFSGMTDVTSNAVDCEKVETKKDTNWSAKVCVASTAYKGTTAPVWVFCPEACQVDCTPTMQPSGTPSVTVP